MATTADLSRLDAILKDRALAQGIIQTLNTATPLIEKFTGRIETSGRKAIRPVSFGVNEGVFSRADKGTFGDSQVDSPDLAEITVKFMYALFEISGPTMAATSDSAGAFEEALSLELENTITGVKLDQARQLLNLSSNGLIGLVQSRTNSTTYVVDSPYGLTTYKQNRPVRFTLRRNMAIDVIDAGDGTTKHVDNEVISAVSNASAGTTMTIGGEADTGAADGDYVVRAGDLGYEQEGFFSAIQTTGSYLTISRTGNEGWQGVLVDAADGGSATVSLSLNAIRDTIDTIAEVSGEQPGFLVMNYKQRRNMINLLQPQVRFAPMVLPAGVNDNTLSFDGLPVLVERFFPPEHIGFVNTNHWYNVVNKDMEWIEGLNGTVLHFNKTQDVFTAVLRMYRNFACLWPATNGVLYGLSE